jgi:hypothetical protein
LATLGLLFSVLSLVACSATQEAPVLALLRDTSEKVPVILVPGITGSELRDRVSGELAWGKGKNLLFPRDGGYTLALPIEAKSGSEPRLEAGEVIDEVRLAWIRTPVYGPIAKLLQANGYRRGDLVDPNPGENLFLFSYDWRQDNIKAVQLLFKRLQALRRARGEEELSVALICQSNGGYICRYLAKYGAASLQDAEAGRAAPPEKLRITRMLFVGTASGGSIRILRLVDRGRNYVPLVGRDLLPEVLFTFPSIFQDLPAYRQDLFLDEEGRALPVDLYDAENWWKYGWSVFSQKARKRLTTAPVELFADEAARRRFLTHNLARAERFQALLHAEAAGYEPPPYFMIQNVYRQTPERAVLGRKDEEWRLLFSGDKELKKKSYLLSLASGPGDDHATLGSQLWLSEKEKAAIAVEVFNIEGGHFEMILDRGTHRRMLDFLAQD